MSGDDHKVAQTPAEVRALADLRKLAKKWPQTLRLFSWSGSLIVHRMEDEIGSAHYNTPTEHIIGIPNDGGDP